MSTIEAIKELLDNWTKLEQEAEAKFPSETQEQRYERVANAMNASLGLAQ